MSTKKKTTTQDYLVIVIIGLVALLALNYVGDFTYRGAVNEHIDNSNKNFQTLVDVNNINVERINEMETNVTDRLNEMDDDVTDNVKAIDKLLGILIRGEF